MPSLDLDVAVLALGTAEAWGFWSSTSAHVSGRAPTRGAGTMGQPCHEFSPGRWGCSCGSLPGDLWEQESGINGFAESLTLGIVLEGWCRACGDRELGRCRVGEHRGRRGRAGAVGGRRGGGWLRCCTATAREIWVAPEWLVLPRAPGRREQLRGTGCA